MIKAFVSQVGQGRTLCSVSECVSQVGKKVAYISCETSEKDIMKFAKAFEVKCSKFTVFRVPTGAASNLYEKVKKLKDEYDIICIDAAYVFPRVSFKKLEEICFDSFFNNCEQLWVTLQLQKEISGYTEKSVLKAFKNSDFENIKIKKVCRIVDNPFMPGVKFVQAIDLETKEINNYNLNKLFKNN